MTDMTTSGVLIWLGVMSFAGSVVAIYDKLASKSGKRRISENTLMSLGFIGSALGMYITMRLIRHKTRHKKFMIGLPLFILLHISVIAAVVYLGIR